MLQTQGICCVSSEKKLRRLYIIHNLYTCSPFKENTNVFCIWHNDVEVFNFTVLAYLKKSSSKFSIFLLQGTRPNVRYEKLSIEYRIPSSTTRSLSWVFLPLFSFFHALCPPHSLSPYIPFYRCPQTVLTCPACP